MRPLYFAGCLLLLGPACTGTTAKLPADLEARIQREGIVRRAADLTFRYTQAPGHRNARWEDRRASIVVTHTTILIHKNAKIGLEVTPRTQREVAIERDGRRVRLRAGEGRAEEVWSFEPPDGDAVGWTRDLRAVLQHGLPRSDKLRTALFASAPGGSVPCSIIPYVISLSKREAS